MGKMSRIWKIVLGISALISLHGIGYAAVTSLSDTNYAVRATTYGQTPIPQQKAPQASDGPSVGCKSPVTCPNNYIYHYSQCEFAGPNYNSPTDCAKYECCNGQTDIMLDLCPDNFIYNDSIFELEEAKKIIDVGVIDLCYGNNRSNGKTVLSNNDISMCLYRGLIQSFTDKSLSSDSFTKADDYNATLGTCTNSRDESIRYYGYVDPSDEKHYKSLIACPASNYSGPSTDSDMCNEDDPANEHAAIPCQVQCGEDSLMCLAFTCSYDTLQTCGALVEAKENEGYHTTDIASEYSLRTPVACKQGSKIGYVGFYCKGYDLGNNSSCKPFEGGGSEDCHFRVNATDDEDTYFYKCTGCGTDYITKEESCADQADYENCLQQSYCSSNECILDKDADGNIIQKCDDWSRDTSCNYLMSIYQVIDRPSEGCENTYDNEDLEEECVYQDANGFNKLKTVCTYCSHSYSSLEEATTKCTEVNGEPRLCSYQTDPNNKVYAGCTCPTGWKTKRDFCSENHAFGLKITIGSETYEDIDSCIDNYIVSVGKTCQTYPADEMYNQTVYESFDCPAEYKTKAEWCAANADEIVSGYDCMTDYVGYGTACTVLKVQTGNEADIKYTGYVLKCPDGQEVQDDKNNCKVSGDDTSSINAIQCYEAAEDGSYTAAGLRYLCRCPYNYGTTCEDSTKERGGTACTYDTDENGLPITKYKNCNYICGTEYAKEYSDTTNDCPNVGVYPSGVRGGNDNPEMCTQTGTKEEKYICACPPNFKTLNEWCSEEFGTNEDGSMTDEYRECVYNYTGSGAVCRYDIGNSKYAEYMRFCPSDRPLYYSEEDCQFIGGELDFTCNDENANQRTACKCLSTYYDPAATEEDENFCDVQNVTVENANKEIKSEDYTAEPSGITCDLEGNDNLKYRDCVARCDVLLADTAQDGAYRYLSSEESTPTSTLCKMEMGNGAKFGFESQAYCSANNTLVYPCYCPAAFVECSEANQLPAENATMCRSGDITYYSACSFAECSEESSTIAIEEGSKEYQELVNTYGSGAEIVKCTLDGVEKWQVSCDSSTYTDPCDYPYEKPDGDNFCKYGDGSTLMKNGRPHYLNGACKILKELSECGKNVMINGEKVTSMTITSVVNSENECASKHGPGISVQLCEYGADTGYKRAYNCYYDPTEFKYTTANCGVRHDLTGDYVIINGKKTWKECLCASAYKHHKYNCGGLLSGNACQQEITSDFMRRDSSVNEAVDEGYLKLGQSLPLYPYCECSAEYTEVCDEDGSGRYQGVGTACNGKYKSCQCVPDELPENWADNYYGCPGGKKPTGVWKDNGCGKKYYQCSVIECTWEYTEKCDSPLIPVGQACQDNQGNVGGYKACSCPAEYKVCPTGQVGVGEPCNLKGVSYYKKCEAQTNCTSLATETCSGPLQIGVNPCTRDNTTYYESCTCANGYDKVCGEGEVGVGNYCELNGVKYYKECTKPETNECTPGHVTACDTNQESYSPCVSTDAEGKQTIKYLCKCPSNWQACEGGSGDKCTQTNADGSKVTYWSECNASAANCTPFQEETYKVCTSAQIGEGGSCTSTTTSTGEDGSSTSASVVKYASCRDTNNCLTNGFKYSCSGYDPAYLGESCIDENGNKLYKSCPCPSSYKTCDTQNATKGKKCTPLNSDGSFGTTVYSTCECDRTKYKYTCQASETGNKGIVPPSGNDYCEVVETSTTTTTDPDTGATSTSTQETRTKYYKSCECASEYKYSCSGASAGEVLPSGYENDYCQINASKFYKGCDCTQEYSVTAADCNAEPGAMVNVNEGSCVVRGVVPTSEGGLKTNDTYYKGCMCKPQFTLPCTDNNSYDQAGLTSCSLNGTDLYDRCLCKKDEMVICNQFKGADNKPDANNTVIGKGSCIDRFTNVDGSSYYSGDEYFESCSCPNDYNIPASSCDAAVHIIPQQYCHRGDTNEKFYNACPCDADLFDTSNGLNSNDAEAYCTGKGLSVDETYTGPQFCKDPKDNDTYYAAERLCGCDITIDTEVYKEFAGKYDSVQQMISALGETGVYNRVKEKCGHGYNATFIAGCEHKIYYKCSVDLKEDVTYYDSETCGVKSANLNDGDSSVLELSEVGASINASWERDIWLPLNLYTKCSCPASYNKPNSCLEKGANESIITQLRDGTLEGPICFDYGRISGTKSPQMTTNGFIGGTCKIITEGEECIDDDGVHYNWSMCRCDTAEFSTVPADKRIDFCTDWDDKGVTCHFYFCVDNYNGGNIRRRSDDNKGDKNWKDWGIEEVEDGSGGWQELEWSDKTIKAWDKF